MDLLEIINNCNSDEEVNKIIKEKIEEADKNSIKVPQLGFLENGKTINVFKGFIPLNTRIKYMNFAMETYSMQTTDYFYEFAHFLRKYKINNKGVLIQCLESFINSYFGLSSKNHRESIFNDRAWQMSITDEEYFNALENNKIGDLKGMNAAMCTERSAMAEQLLSLFDIETYYCMGCINLNNKEEAHCFNIVKRKNDYALLDYSMPIISLNSEGIVNGYYPFIGILANEEFNEFINGGILKEFPNYEINNNKKEILDTRRLYIIGEYTINRENQTNLKK